MGDDNNNGRYRRGGRGRGGRWNNDAGQSSRGRGTIPRYRPYTNWRGRGRNNYNQGNRSHCHQDSDYLIPMPMPLGQFARQNENNYGNLDKSVSPYRQNWKSYEDEKLFSEKSTLLISDAGTESNEASALELSVSSYAGSSPPPRLKQQKLDSLIMTQMAQKYPGLGIYFPSALSFLPDIPEKITAAMNYLIRNEVAVDLEAAFAIQNNEYVDLPYEQILADEEFVDSWPSFETDLLNHARDVVNVFGLCIHTLVHNVFVEAQNKDSESDRIDANDDCEQVQNSSALCSKVDVPQIYSRIMKLSPLSPIDSIRSTMLGKFVTIRGAVIRTGTIKPYCIQMTYRCTDCLKSFVLEQVDGRCCMPSKCPSLECRSKTFEALEKEKTTKFGLVRTIKLQGIQHDGAERGTVPRSIDCQLTNTLHNIGGARDAVTLCGIVKFHHECGGGFGVLDQQLHNFYIDVIAIRNHKDCNQTMGGNWFIFSPKDYRAVEEIRESDKLFRLLVASLCPTIFGHDLVKAGLLLCLFGGSPQDKESTISRRSDINVLIVGDPGIGKSQMLSVVCDVAPRGVYVCGTSTTVAGLTVTLVKEGDDYSLEAGALVMADKGVCCIDEFDKMQAQHHALLEAMEQQSISIAKSGVCRTLPARASVIAAANPVGGHYNPMKSVEENIRINPALLSRFDLVFILVDKSDEEADTNIVNHILGMRGCSTNLSIRSQTQNAVLAETESLSLRERLKFGRNENVDLIPHHLLRKYIAYARQNCVPILSPEAGEVIKTYYKSNRVKHRNVNTISVTTRQLESLLRLTQARAKLEMRDVATEDDAKDVLEIFEFGMASVLEDDIIVGTPFSHLTSSSRGGPKKSHTKGMTKKLLSALENLSCSQSKDKFTFGEIKQVAESLGIGNGIETLVSSLNSEGFLLNKGGRVYQLQSADF